MGHLLAHCSDISLFHALATMSKDLFSKLFLSFYWPLQCSNLVTNTVLKACTLQITHDKRT